MNQASKKVPPLPDNIGKVRRRIKNIHGQERSMRVEGEVKLRLHRKNPDATFALYLQRFKVLKDPWGDDVLYRFGYYAIQVKGKNKGKWGWGQSSVMARPKEFTKILQMARKKSWNI